MGEIEDERVELQDGESPTVILKRDPSKDGNVFGGSSLYFNYSTTSGTSTLTLQKDPSLNTDMSYFIQGNMQVSGNSHLIMNLNSTGSKGLFKLDGGAIKVYNSSLEINDVNNFVIDKKGMMSGELKVTNVGTLKINNVDTLINISGNFGASISNDNSTLYIEADVYNYDKNSLEGGGNFTQISNNAKTTIGVLFIMLVLRVVSKAEKKP